MSLPFHLCQPGGGASCGACCGLYNFKDHARANVAEALRRHTLALKDAPRTREAFSAIARELKQQEAAPAFVDVRVCPLLGFVDGARESHVGCLAHPKQNVGVDLRDCGVYDARTCESFECPSFLWLTAAEAEWIRAACPDWYLYGLVITDVDFVRGIEKLIERATGERFDPRRALVRPEAVQASSRLFALKESAPGRAQDGAIFGRFGAPPEDLVARDDERGANSSTEPRLRTIDYDTLGARAAPEDDVVLCLGYAPRSAAALEAARDVVRSAVGALVSALRANEQIGPRN